MIREIVSYQKNILQNMQLCNNYSCRIQYSCRNCKIFRYNYVYLQILAIKVMHVTAILKTKHQQCLHLAVYLPYLSH